MGEYVLVTTTERDEKRPGAYSVAVAGGKVLEDEYTENLIPGVGH